MASKRPWPKSRILRECKRMDDRNWKNEQTLLRIKESGHPLADELAERLCEYTVLEELQNLAESLFEDWA